MPSLLIARFLPSVLLLSASKPAWCFSQKHFQAVSPEGIARSFDEGNKTADRVHVVYSSNSANFVGLLASMISLARNAIHPSLCTIHIIVRPTEMPGAEEVVNCFKNELQDQRQTPDVQLHELQPLPICWECLPSTAHFWVPEAFVRMYLPTYLPNVSKAIWLDTDTIVQGDIGKLFWMPMNHSVAAALEPTDWARQKLYDSIPKFIAENISWVTASRMFNSGVLVLDLDRWRKENLMSLCTAMFVVVHGLHADQLTLNAVFQKVGFDVLDPSFNVGCMTLPYIKEKNRMWHSEVIPKYGHILHWSCSGPKPWTRNRSEFWKAQDHLWLKYRPGKCKAIH